MDLSTKTSPAFITDYCGPSDWREKVHNVTERNLFSLKNSILTDVTLEVGPENTPFQAHKLFMALGSPVFEAMFYGPLAEQGEKIKIPDIMPDGFKVLLRHLYGDTISMHNEVEALNAWIAADKYCVKNLKEECNEYFSNILITSSNFWKLLEYAVFFHLVPLLYNCREFFYCHTDSLPYTEDFLEINLGTLKDILFVLRANMREMSVLKHVIRWGKHKVITGKAVSLKEVLKPLLPHIEFLGLTQKEFCIFLEETNGLLETSDALNIFKHLIDPSNYILPDWVCKEGLNRCVSYSLIM